MKKRTKKIYKGFYLIGDYPPKWFDNLQDIAELIGFPVEKCRYAFYYKKIIKDKYIIADHSNVKKCLYSPYTEKNPYKTKDKIKDFYAEQDKYANIQRCLIGFDSYVGINNNKFTPTYALTEQEAMEQQLQIIFDGGTLYIDKGKRIYRKDGVKYYQLTISDRM